MELEFTELDVLHELLDETKLNEMIRESVEINKLGALLKLKSYFIMKGKHQKLTFNFEQIIEIAMINANSEIVQNALLVYSGEQQFQKLFCYLRDNIKSLTSKKNWDFFVTVFNVGLCLSKSINNKNIKNVVAKSATDIFTYVLENIAIKTCLLKEMFVNLATFTGENDITLFLLWNIILKKNDIEALSALAEFFCDNKKDLLVSLINYEEFFILFEKILYSGSEFDRKHILYFWQKVCDVIFQGKDCNCSYISFDTNNKEAIFEAWKYFFSLSEISKEKQIHLLEPALPLLSKISILHPLWLGYISNSFLVHSHKIISYQTLHYLFENKLCDNVNVFQRIVKNILLVLNDTEYSTYTLKSFALLEQFLVASADNLFRIFLKNLFEMNCAPVPFYFMCKTILHCNKALEKTEIEKLITTTEQLPNTFIRYECIFLIEKYFNKYLCENENVTLEHTINILKLSGALCNSEQIQAQIYRRFVSHKEYFIRHIHSKNDFKIINVFKNSKDIKSYIESRFQDPVSENKLPFSVAVHMMHYFPCFINMPILSNYLNFALENNVTTHDITILLSVIASTPVLSTNANSKLGIDLSLKCSYILLNETNVQSNRISLAFEILLQYYNVNAVSTEEVGLIIERWINIFKSDVKTNGNVYLCFLNLYQKEKIAKRGDDVHEFCNFCTSFLEILPYSSYPDLFSYIKILFEKGEKNYQVIFKLVEHYIKRILEINKPHIFEKALETLLDSLILNNKILLSQEFFVKNCSYVLNELMKECKKVIEVPVSISKILLKLSQQNSNELLNFSHVIMELLLYGDLLRKDQVAEFKIYYNSKNKQKQNVFVCQRNLVRINAVNILQNALGDQNSRSTFADTLALVLLDEYILYFKKRYFKNSQIHLRKQRILQALLILLPYIAFEKLHLIDTLMESLCLESNQTSVKLLIQWILIEGMSECYIDIISNKVNGASKTQPSTITSFVFILYSLACKINKEHVWGKIMKEILPWTMGAHFNLRLYAQVSLDN
ncbi:uncharacterized protein LOC108741184 isoform X2 [Agrilus planipennis]|uniref:Uncharacterized protein LOC108741184 isoform X2 n=1 Tax=Agrilus planipennis TaxID=224129 RepID=A0A1W4X5N4_AGRPL|nr:uncharacterized protein LOC108741184 isoform X2 [Agrilus planipennis]